MRTRSAQILIIVLLLISLFSGIMSLVLREQEDGGVCFVSNPKNIEHCNN